MKVIVADNDESVLRLLTRILSRLGHAADAARDGRELVELWKKERYGLVVSDVDMPGKNGIAACLEIRAMAPKVRFILVTGSVELLARAKAAGFSSCLQKPFAVEEFAHLIQRKS